MGRMVTVISPSSVDLVDVAFSAFTISLMSFKAGLAKDIFFSATLDFSKQGGFKSSFDGTKSLRKTGVDGAAGVIFGVGAQQLKNMKNLKDFGKSFGPVIEGASHAGSNETSELLDPQN